MNQSAALLISRDVVQSPKEPILSRIDPKWRLAALFAFALLVVCLERFPSLIGAFLFALAAAFAARTDVKKILRRMAQMDGFMIFVLLTLPFARPGEELFSLGGWSASREGAIIAGQVLLKANAVLLMILALLGRMETADLGFALARMGLPSKLVQLFCFTIRYVNVLGDEYRRLRLAMKARAFSMGFNLHTWRSIGYLFGMLLVRSAERAERIVKAMKLRGFDGQFRSLSASETKGSGFEGAFGFAVLMVGLSLAALEFSFELFAVSPL